MAGRLWPARLPRGEREEREGEHPRSYKRFAPQALRFRVSVGDCELSVLLDVERARFTQRCVFVRGQGGVVSIVRASDGAEGIPAGFPILLDEEMAIIEPAFRYLIKLATIPGRSHAAETVRTYAEHLHDWFDTLEQSRLDWSVADEGTIAAYRNRMLQQVSPHTGRPYARSTVNDRVRTVCRFYSWAHREGLVATLPFDYVDVSVRSGQHRGMLAHLDRRPAIIRANVLTVAEGEALPRPLRIDELQRLFRALGTTYRLMAEWALATGMRRKELCGLAWDQLPEVRHLDIERDPLISLPLAITKGDRPRCVYPPLRLIDRTHWYVGEERAALVKRLRRARPSYRPPAALFLNTAGAPVTHARLTAAFAAAFRAAGLNGTGHWLRHTFAMTMLVRLQRQATTTPDLNPLKVVQVLLGHASIQSTAIYLRCVELHADALIESLAYLYGEVVPHGAS